MKDAKKLAASGPETKAQELLAVLADDPFQNPPLFEQLVGDLAGACSRRINIQHRIVYSVFAKRARFVSSACGRTLSDRPSTGHWGAGRMPSAKDFLPHRSILEVRQ